MPAAIAGRPTGSGEKLGQRGDDPVRGIPLPGQSQLFPGLLPGGDKKRPADPGDQPRGADYCAVPGHAHLRHFRRITTQGPGKGRDIRPLRTRCAAPGSRGRTTQVEVTFTDPILDRSVTVETDALLLSTGFVSDDESTEDLAAIFKCPGPRTAIFWKTMSNCGPWICRCRAFSWPERPMPRKTSVKASPRPKPPGPGPDTAGPKNHQPGCGRGPGGLKQMRGLPDLRPGLPLWRSFYQRRRIFGNRSGQMPWMRRMRVGMPGQGDTDSELRR